MPGASGRYRVPALMCPTAFASPERMRLLLEHGAEGETALLLAARRRGNTATVRPGAVRSNQKAGSQRMPLLVAKLRQLNYRCTGPRYLSSQSRVSRINTWRSGVTSCEASRMTWRLLTAGVPRRLKSGFCASSRGKK